MVGTIGAALTRRPFFLKENIMLVPLDPKTGQRKKDLSKQEKKDIADAERRDKDAKAAKEKAAK